MGAKLLYKRYVDRKSQADHDHCEFCGTKFSDIVPYALKAGYTTIDEYRWICQQCFDDFKEMFVFTIADNQCKNKMAIPLRLAAKTAPLRSDSTMQAEDKS
jgi:hypothetical protein